MFCGKLLESLYLHAKTSSKWGVKKSFHNYLGYSVRRRHPSASQFPWPPGWLSIMGVYNYKKWSFPSQKCLEAGPKTPWTSTHTSPSIDKTRGGEHHEVKFLGGYDLLMYWESALTPPLHEREPRVVQARCIFFVRKSVVKPFTRVNKSIGMKSSTRNYTTAALTPLYSSSASTLIFLFCLFMPFIHCFHSARADRRDL
jgi:hypothetical protein